MNLNPLGQGGDFVAFPVVGDVGYALEHATDFSGVRTDIRNFRSPENKLASVTLDATLLNGVKKCYVQNPSRNAMPMLRTEFKTSSDKVRKARLYVTSRGIYEMYLNGQRVGEDYFNPGVTLPLEQFWPKDGGAEEQLMPEKTGISLATVSHCWHSWL